ncbi:Carboxypeptidase C [Bertholletia excelsa]
MESTRAQRLLKLLLIHSVVHHSLPLCFAAQTPLFPTEALPTKSGYLPVNSATGSAIFYTFYEAQTPNSSLPQIPLLIWLQGGPGQDAEQLVLKPNCGSWNRIFGLLFLDNPIGTGFSIASTPEEIPRDQLTVAKHLFAAISSFVALNSSFKSRPIYVTGESYAGKYVPAIGHYILKKNPQLPVSKRLNLAGVAIGNGLTHPVTQVATHAMSAYFSGLINRRQKIQLEKLQDQAVELTEKGNWRNATDAREEVLNSLQTMTGLATLYDFRRLIPYQESLVTKFLNQAEVKKLLGVNESMVFEECSDAVGAALQEDVMKSVKYKLEFLVQNTKVLLYQGQCDLRDGVVSTEAWVKNMKWKDICKFMEAEKRVWEVKGKLAGYVQKWGSLSHVVVMGAGHLVPTDQPENSQAMIEDWVLERNMFADVKDQTSSFRGAL